MIFGNCWGFFWSQCVQQISGIYNSFFWFQQGAAQVYNPIYRYWEITWSVVGGGLSAYIHTSKRKKKKLHTGAAQWGATKRKDILGASYGHHKAQSVLQIFINISMCVQDMYVQENISLKWRDGLVIYVTWMFWTLWLFGIVTNCVLDMVNRNFAFKLINHLLNWSAKIGTETHRDQDSFVVRRI